MRYVHVQLILLSRKLELKRRQTWVIDKRVAGPCCYYLGGLATFEVPELFYVGPDPLIELMELSRLGKWDHVASSAEMSRTLDEHLERCSRSGLGTCLLVPWISSMLRSSRTSISIDGWRVSLPFLPNWWPTEACRRVTSDVGPCTCRYSAMLTFCPAQRPIWTWF